MGRVRLPIIDSTGDSWILLFKNKQKKPYLVSTNWVNLPLNFKTAVLLLKASLWALQIYFWSSECLEILLDDVPGYLLSFLLKPFFIWVIINYWTTVQLALCNHTESNFDTPYQPLRLEEFKRQTRLFIIWHTWQIRNIRSCCKSRIFMVCLNVLCKLWPADVSNSRFYNKLMKN